MVVMDSFYITLIEYVLLLLFCAISTAIAAFALFLLYRLNRHRNFNAAPSLIVYLSSFGVCCAALTVQYTLLTLSSVFDSQSLFSSLSPTQYIFWTGLVPGSLIPATPICVFFLSIDRLLIILKPSILISVVALFGMSFGVNLAQRPRTEHPECISFGCLTSDASRLIYAVNRLAVALPNFLAGTAFLAALFAFRRRLERLINRTNNNSTVGPSSNLTTKTAMVNTDSRKMSDRLTFHCVLFEFLLDLLPNFINLILTAFDFNISVYVGAFRSMTYAACAFCSVLAHTTILWSIFKSNIISMPIHKSVRGEHLTIVKTKAPPGGGRNGINANGTLCSSANREHIRIVPVECAARKWSG
uniref:G protein-coupled receptor n=1 Tax=Globodera rostochiensis TaxID=31243 RepID=A0A914GPF5_GLORO